MAFLSAPCEARYSKELSLTASPNHLFIPMLEGMAEYAVEDDWSGAVILGYGRPTFSTSAGKKLVVPEAELGVIGRFSPACRFLP